MTVPNAWDVNVPGSVTLRGVKEHFKVDKSCRKGRMFSDFTEYLKDNPDVSPVQIDTVEGIKGGPVLLTVHFLDTSFMLAFLRGANTARSVSDVFDGLYSLLGIESFKLLFPVILTDNGSEFSAPMALEKDAGGIRRCRVFYCEPSSPFQKGAIENNRELIRRIIPKGKSFGGLSQPQIQLMMDHINSYNRKWSRLLLQSCSYFCYSQIFPLIFYYRIAYHI